MNEYSFINILAMAVAAGSPRSIKKLKITNIILSWKRR
jgi:hypothetical protein